ncbi:hypothetical protein Tco_1058361 [Tanacetum coccineum]|uniref:Uncharacterized protein n=1 Tax=Tanacetum coccineum TaxID=301880 RepID=A0ABQ5H8Q8_9ASTR
MHNNIMTAGSKDRPPMLRPGRYSQWRSHFLRYIDTKPNGNPTIQQHTTIETVLNMTKKEAILLLLTGIGDDIYSTVDAYKTANEMWIAIERLPQGKSLNIQDVKTNLFWEFGKFTSRDGESMESYYSRMVKICDGCQAIKRNRHHLISHTVNILKQYQNEVNDIRAERIAKSANPLVLLAAAQPYSDNYYQAPKPQRSNATSSSTRPSASTKHKGKEIAKPVTPQSELVSKEDSDPEQAQRDKDMQKNLALLAKYFKSVTPPKSQQRSGIPLGVLLHSSYTQVTENDLKRDV